MFSSANFSFEYLNIWILTCATPSLRRNRAHIYCRTEQSFQLCRRKTLFIFCQLCTILMRKMCLKEDAFVYVSVVELCDTYYCQTLVVTLISWNMHSSCLALLHFPAKFWLPLNYLFKLKLYALSRPICTYPHTW